MSSSRERFEDRIRRLVSYDHDTGLLTWKEKPNRNITVGRRIGKVNSWGHMSFAMLGKTLLVHRVAWFLYHGSWPKYQIDHIDGDKTNNRISNLRDVPQSKNMQNIFAARKDNTSGLRGAHKATKKGAKFPWESSIKANGKRVYLGGFATAVEAHQAYIKAKERLHDTAR